MGKTATREFTALANKASLSLDTRRRPSNDLEVAVAIMGVKGLLNILKSVHKSRNLESFRGQTMGVDAYCWLHRGAMASAVDLSLGKSTRRYIDFVMRRLRMILHFGIQPYIVFDGDNLPSKAQTEQGRACKRASSKKAGLDLLRLGKHAEAFQELKKAVDVTPEMAKALIEELRILGIRYVVAPYEADAQLAYLEENGFIDGIISEDSDLLVFGSRCLLTKLDENGNCIVIQSKDFAACSELDLHDWTLEKLRMMAILTGCDYLSGIHNMGLKTAYKLIQKYKTIDRVLRVAQLEGKFQIPPDYLERYIQAERTFLYQWVFCPANNCLVHLKKPPSPLVLDGVGFIGDFIPKAMAQKIANGEVNPITKMPLHTKAVYSHYKSTTLTSRRAAGIKRNQRDPQGERQIDSFFRPERCPLTEISSNCSKSKANMFGPQQSRKRTPRSPFLTSSSGTSLPGAAVHVFFDEEQDASRLEARKGLKISGESTDSFDALEMGEDNLRRSKFFPFSQIDPTMASRQTSQKRKSSIDENDVQIQFERSIGEAAVLCTPSLIQEPTRANETKRPRRQAPSPPSKRTCANAPPGSKADQKSNLDPDSVSVMSSKSHKDIIANAKNMGGLSYFDLTSYSSSKFINTLDSSMKIRSFPPRAETRTLYGANVPNQCEPELDLSGDEVRKAVFKFDLTDSKGSEDLYNIRGSEDESESIANHQCLSEPFDGPFIPTPKSEST